MKRTVPVSHPTKPTPGFAGAPVESASAFISASASIDEKIKELGDWRGKTLAKVREIIHEADPEIVEEWKWMGTPIWSHGGLHGRDVQERRQDDMRDSQDLWIGVPR